ncbi:MAG: Type 1 glutamine amidotransferase-like domain-containing protein [Candidatus Spechtbacterales bacterium]
MELFLTSQAHRVLPQIAKELAGQPSAYRVAFVPTAADPYQDAYWMREDRDALVGLGFVVFDVDIAGKSYRELQKQLKDAHILFVAGGNTCYLLEKAQESGFDRLVKELVQRGVIYVGSSAGSVIAAPDIEPCKFFDEREKANLTSTEAFGLVDFLLVPHWGNKEVQRLNEQAMEEYKDWQYKLVRLTDTQYVHIKDGIQRTVDIGK